MQIRETTIVTPAAARDFADLATLKLDLDVSGTADDAWLSRAIRRASDTITSYTGRTFGVQTVSDVFRRRHIPLHLHVFGHAGRRRPEPVVLSAWPVRTVTSVTRTHDGDPVDPADYFLDAPAGTLTLHRTFGDVTAVYDAGFLLPGQDGRDLPADVEEICTALVSAAYYGRGRDPAVQLEAAEGAGQLRYRDRGASPMELDDSMRARLRPYICR